MSKKNKKKEQPRFDPVIDTGENRPVRARIAIKNANDKYSEYPSSGLTPRRLAAIFREADEGIVYRQMELFEEMEEKDTHLFSQLQTRKLAVTSLDWEIQPFSADERDKKIADFVKEQLKSLDNLPDIFLDILDAIGKGISVSEIEWDISPEGNNIISNIEWVHPKKLVWDAMTDEMKICTKDYPSGVEFPENKFVIHKYKAKSGHPSRAGVLRVVSWMYLFKNYDLKDWVSFCEVFGMPLRLGIYNQSASEEDKAALAQAIIDLGSDAAGIIPESTSVKFIESQKLTSAEIYENLARYADEQTSKAILGQTLSSDSGGGSYAQGKVHNEVRHDLTEADAASLAATVRRDVIRPLVIFNFGPDAHVPFFSFNSEEAEDQKELVNIYKTLVCDIGLEIPKDHLYSKFNIPAPEPGDNVVSPIPKMMPPSQLKLKDDKLTPEQLQIDGMAGMAEKKAAESFKKMLEPVLKIIDEYDSLDEARVALKDKGRLKELYKDMQDTDLEDIIHQAIYISQLIGRSME